MSPKSVVLAAAAVAVLAMAVYLFVQVRATPAQASGSGASHPMAPRPREPIAEAPREHTAPPVVEGKRTTPITRSGLGPQKTPDPGLEPVEDDRTVDLKADNLMGEANKAYDRQDFDEAMSLAAKVLAKDPNNIRMLRIMVSASCISGDPAIAQAHYEKLPKFDREQMKQRCDRYGVTFKD
ncbi:MAG: hypothetical protein HOV81_44435 [Kofleriaceae bacterium]|nr:hypothetical protein [Kofleriaceae bacterium]